MQHEPADRGGGRAGKFKQTGPPDAELAVKAQAGDIEARNQLIMRHIGYLHMLVRRVLSTHRRSDASEELICVAIESFARAIKQYDPSRGAKITSMASKGIMSQLNRALWADSPITRPGAWPPNAENVEAWKRAGHQTVELVMKGDARALERVGCSGEEAYERLEHEERRLLARWAIEQLDERSQAVIVMRNVEQLTLKEVGAVLGLSKERVRQIEDRAIDRMRELVAA